MNDHAWIEDRARGLTPAGVSPTAHRRIPCWRRNVPQYYPVGLREAVLYIVTQQSRFTGFRDITSPVLRTAWEWSRGKGCTPAQWRELVHLFGFDHLVKENPEQ